MHNIINKTILILSLATVLTVASNNTINNNMISAKESIKDNKQNSEILFGSSDINKATNINIGDSYIESSHINGYFVFEALENSEYTFEFSEVNTEYDDRIKQFSVYLYKETKENELKQTCIKYNNTKYDKVTLVSPEGMNMYSGVADSLQDYTDKMERLNHKILFTNEFKTSIKLKKGQKIYFRQVCINNTGRAKISISN